MTLVVSCGAMRRAMPVPQPPFNAATPLTTPTPDGTGSGLHPSVVDMGGPWHGWRYWMAFTPYVNSDWRIEDPCILASPDGLSWQVPAGLANPVDPRPGDGSTTDEWANSDTELVHDPDTDELVLMWREYRKTPGFEILWVSRSADGVTWSAPVEAQVAAIGNGIERLLSPSLIRVSSSQWYMFVVRNNGYLYGMRYEAAAPEGPWSGGITLWGDGTANDVAHIDVVRHGGYWYAIGHRAQTGNGIRAYWSVDGLAWQVGPVILHTSSAPPGAWDGAEMYRATMTVESAKLLAVWYSGKGAQWRIGRTAIPAAYLRRAPAEGVIP